MELVKKKKLRDARRRRTEAAGRICPAAGGGYLLLYREHPRMQSVRLALLGAVTIAVLLAAAESSS
ncbi:hypothetical protein, partial [Halogeometricum sp. CBA1124]|uniref:hypothetical protein n=1 Tax=Halogeometricum sp. CBA1124 TaxID=2668071 RepID=UPI00142ACE39